MKRLYMRLGATFRSIEAVRVCERRPISAHGSVRRIRTGTVSNVNRAGVSRGVSSAHETGVDTGMPSRARGEYGATQVAPRRLRSVSMRILPRRRVFESWVVKRSGSRRTISDAIPDEKAATCAQSGPRRIGTTT